MLGGSAFSQLGALIDNPASLPNLLGTALPASSNFFINYIIIQARWPRALIPLHNAPHLCVACASMLPTPPRRSTLWERYAAAQMG